MTTAGYPSFAAFNGIAINSGSGVLYSMFETVGNFMDMGYFPAAPAVGSVTDVRLSAVEFRIHPQTAAPWFIRGTVAVNDPYPAITPPVETTMEIRAQLFNYTIDGVETTLVDEVGNTLNITVPGGVINLRFDVKDCNPKPPVASVGGPGWVTTFLEVRHDIVTQAGHDTAIVYLSRAMYVTSYELVQT